MDGEQLPAPVGGLTDTEREALTRAFIRDSMNGGDRATFATVERIKADAYRQGHADLAAKVEVGQAVYEYVRGYTGNTVPIPSPGLIAGCIRRAVLAADSREDVTHTHLSMGHVEGCPACVQVREMLERSSFGTPDAVAARASVSDEHAARIVARARELEAEERCGSFPPGMHVNLRHAIGAQYHGCHERAGHEGPHHDGKGTTWGFPEAPSATPLTDRLREKRADRG